MTELPAEPYYKVRRRKMTALALCGAIAVLAGVYGIGRLRSNPAAAACASAVETAGRIAPLAHGEVAAFDGGAYAVPRPRPRVQGRRRP